MKKISCVGYHATGSGAVDDFLREFDNIEAAKYGIECRFLQDPDGVSDLEYNLIENPHRLNSGFALKRFLCFAKAEKRTYRHIFGDRWLEWAEEYVQELSKFTYKGYWYADVWIMSPIKRFVYKARRAFNLVLPKKLKKNKYYNYFPNISTYCVDITESEFLRITQNSCEKLCKLLNTENKEYVVLDQVASPQNVGRYLRYISDLKVIVVDRDPRDVYLNDIVRNDDFVLPKDVHKFCDVYRMSRKVVENENENGNVLRIHFEDMIYHYDETTKKIMNFLGLSEKNHVYKQQYFIPEVSAKNTKIWLTNSKYQEISEIIESQLPEFLYSED